MQLVSLKYIYILSEYYLGDKAKLEVLNCLFEAVFGLFFFPVTVEFKRKDVEILNFKAPQLGYESFCTSSNGNRCKAFYMRNI